MLKNFYKKGDISPRISNKVLSTILHTELIQCNPHRMFAYCYLGILSYLKYNRKYEFYNINVKDIKAMLQVSTSGKKVDYIIKKGGVLNQLGFIEDVENPYPAHVKNRVKFPLVLDELEDCHTFNLKLFMKCMENNKIKLSGFFIANYIKEFHPNYVYGVRGSIAKISKELNNMSEQTVGNYLEELAKENLVSKNTFRGMDTVNEFNIYLRSKLNQWKIKSMDIHDSTCFVTGKKENIIIHHIIPFNQIRDNVLNSLDIENKKFSELSEEELLAIEKRIFDYHKLILGIPLNKSVHQKFHMVYGSYATIEDLLEFKYQYES